MSLMEYKFSKLDTKNHKLIQETADLYCNIWKEPPWNEYFWTVAQVIEDINKEMKRLNALGFLALTRFGNVVGFTWGYEVSKKDMAIISGTNALDYLFGGEKRFFYIDELGVARNFRREGIGRRLSEHIIASDHNHANIRHIILRTDVQAKAARNLYSKLGFKDLEIEDKEHPDRTYWLLKMI